MGSFRDLFQSADWKQEKHVPVIDGPSSIKKGDAAKIILTVGKEVPHPNTAEHHIKFIEVYFHPKDEKFPYQVGRFELTSHGASTGGPNTSTVYTLAEVTCSIKTEKSGTIYVSSYCNIHGLWQNSKELNVD